MERRQRGEYTLCDDGEGNETEWERVYINVLLSWRIKHKGIFGVGSGGQDEKQCVRGVSIIHR